MPHRILIASFLLGCLCAPTFAIEYNVTQIPIVPGGYQTGTATSVDNQGEVAGYDIATNGDTQAFYWTQGAGSIGLTGIVGMGGATNSQALGVNNGNVVGFTDVLNDQTESAFRWTPSAGLVSLGSGILGGSVAAGINSSGEIVGTVSLPNFGPSNAVVWSPSNVLSDPFPTSTPANGTAINNLGQVTGFSGLGYFNDGLGSTLVDLGTLHPNSLSDNQFVAGSSGNVAGYEYLHDSTNIITIGTLPGDTTSNALAVNPLGTEIVGVSNGQGGFIYDTSGASAGSLLSLTSLLAPAYSGWTITSANSINDNGWIAATGVFNGVQEAVLLTPELPVPEPNTLVLAGIAIAGLLGFRCRPLRRSLLLTVPLALLLLCAPTFAIEYNVTQIPIVPGGYQTGTATSVDNQGEVAGYDIATNGDTQAFYWTQAGGSLGLTGVTNSQAFGVNNGNVVGTSGINGQAFRWTGGSGTVLLDPTFLGQANGVNDSGEAVGNRTDSLVNNRVVTWSSGNTLSNPFPTGNLTGTAINNLGQFVGVLANVQGYFNDGLGSTLVNLGTLLPNSLSDNQFVVGSSSQIAGYEYLHDGTNIITIGTLGGDTTSNALGVNPLGTEIVGYSLGDGNTYTGFIYNTSGSSAGSLQSLTSLLAPAYSGWTITSANSINDNGWIAATGVFNGVQEAVLLTPVPEPSSLVLGVLASLGLLALHRRRWQSLMMMLVAFLFLCVQSFSNYSCPNGGR